MITVPGDDVPFFQRTVDAKKQTDHYRYSYSGIIPSWL